MPIQWTISHPNRLVVAVCRDKVSRTDIEGYLDDVVVADTLPYRKIFDMTHAVMVLSDDDMMALGARIRAYAGLANMGPLAIVASSSESYERARLFAWPPRRRATSERACLPCWPTPVGRSRSSVSCTRRVTGWTRRRRSRLPHNNGVFRGWRSA